ncbi:MAG: hypothetical protein ACK50U_05730 [Acidobacteriota bacterium]
MLKCIPLLLLVLVSCRPNRDLSQYTVEDKDSNLTAHIRTANPKHAAQLLSGFHQIEQEGWRWAAARFSVQLKAPFGSPKLGATLTLRGNFPDLVHARTGPVRITARLNEFDLPPYTIQKPGDFAYSADVPAQAFAADRIVATFATDKSIPPNTFPGDGRELALILATISLDTKQ